jgi:diaminopimelate decarboxylase
MTTTRLHKPLPFTHTQISEIVQRYPTPFHLYDEKHIRAFSQRLLAAFAWNPGFKEYFAVKATPNPTILSILKAEGLGADCSSLAELCLSERVGITGEDIMFTSNATPAKDYQKARELGAIINLDDLTHLDYLADHAGLPELISFRFNPGHARSGNVIIGSPEEAKFGCTEPQILEGFQRAKAMGVTRFGLHTMVASNELNGDYIVDTAQMLFELANKLHQQLGIRLEFVNLGGGIGIPYHPEEQGMDIEQMALGIRAAYEAQIVANGLDPLKIFMECGRAITGPYGYLISQAIHTKAIYKNYVGLDATMADLMRPGMYEAYHHITVLGKESAPHDHVYDVTGSLCENNDKFAVDRALPKIEPGDTVVIHDTGAHGHSMGFNYNGKLRSAELLLKTDGSVQQIRRAETLDDYFATLADFWPDREA